MAPSTYEKQALKEIEIWKNPQIGWFGYAMKVINAPINKAGDLVLSTPGVGKVMKLSAQGLISLCNDTAQWTVRPNSILNEYRNNGYSNIKTLSDIYNLDLVDCDKVVGWLAAKYKGIALSEGAGTGAVGLPGIPVNIVALVTMNLRAIGEYATYYGFDISTQHERFYAMNVLGLASSPSDASKGLAMAQLTRIAHEVAKKKTWKELEKHAFVKLAQQVAKSVGVRLTKAKLAQIVPLSGAAIGAGFDVYFTNKVCDAAYYLYRERFLAEKYGEKVINMTTEPIRDFTGNFPD